MTIIQKMVIIDYKSTIDYKQVCEIEIQSDKAGDTKLTSDK